MIRTFLALGTGYCLNSVIFRLDGKVSDHDIIFPLLGLAIFAIMLFFDLSKGDKDVD